MSTFSEQLKHLRKQSHMTQPELAKKIGVSRSSISMYEVGAREPDFETLEAIADIFNVDMNTLVGNSNLQTKPSSPTDEDIKFALFGKTEIDDATYESVKKFAKFAAEQEKKEGNN